MVFPLLLIGLGVILLLVNLGAVDPHVWVILLRMWPVLLIAIGVELLFGRRSWAGILLSGAVMAGAMVLAVGLSFTTKAPGGLSSSIAEPLGRATRAEVDIRMGAGRLFLGAHDAPDLLLQGTASEGSGFRIKKESRLSGETLAVDVREEGDFPFRSLSFRRDDFRWDLNLRTGVPIKLKVNTGVGTADLNLERLTLSELRVSAGVGKVTLTLPAQGRFDARLEGGVGETTIYVPRGMAARVRVSTGIGQTSVDGSFDRRDGEWVSPGYDTAADRVDLQVKGGVGKISIRQV